MTPQTTPQNSPRPVAVGDVVFGGDRPFALIAGPCVIENREHTLRHATALRDICANADVPFVFKSSYDKANRTSIDAYRGPGLDEGLAILAEVRSELGVPVLTDVHTEQQARAAGEVIDVLQIPAFLSRQTDLLLAAASTGKTVNVKKAQFMAPEDVSNVVTKLRSGGRLLDGSESAGTENILVTDRGTSFGYRTLVVDFAGFPTMRATGQPLVFDATHAVQRPGGKGTATGGDRTRVPYLAKAAVACGIDGLFMEVHEDPDTAPSDGPNMLVLDSLAPLLDQLRRVQEAVR